MLKFFVILYQRDGLRYTQFFLAVVLIFVGGSRAEDLGVSVHPLGDHCRQLQPLFRGGSGCCRGVPDLYRWDAGLRQWQWQVERRQLSSQRGVEGFLLPGGNLGPSQGQPGSVGRHCGASGIPRGRGLSSGRDLRPAVRRRHDLAPRTVPQVHLVPSVCQRRRWSDLGHAGGPDRRTGGLRGKGYLPSAGIVPGGPALALVMRQLRNMLPRDHVWLAGPATHASRLGQQ